MQSTSMGRLSMPMLSEYQETILRHLLELRKVSSQPVLSGKHLQNALSQRGDFHTKEFVDAMRFLSDNDYINAFRDIGTGNILEINIRPKGLNTLVQNSVSWKLLKRQNKKWKQWSAKKICVGKGHTNSLSTR